MEAAPFFEDVADGPEGGAAYWLKASDGLRIRLAHWPSQGSKGTVLMFPGRTEYAEKYGRSAKSYCENGYHFVAIDWRGQGIADRMAPDRGLGHVDHFSDYQRDVDAVVTHVRSLGLPEPFYMIGHSMGGCIGLRALHNELPVAAAVFSAPMWGILVSPVLRPFALATVAIMPRIGLGKVVFPGRKTSNYVEDEVFENNELTCDLDMFNHMRKQLKTHPDLGLGGPSTAWLREALKEMDALNAMNCPDYPCLTGLGTDETIVEPERIKSRMARWTNGELAIYSGAKHEIMIEVPDVRNDFFAKSIALFEAHTKMPVK